MLLVMLVSGAGPLAGQGLLDQAAWLAGCWATASADSSAVVEEQWMVQRGGLMVGMGRSYREGRPVEYELVTLREEAGRLVYRAYPSGQAVTDFPARSVTADRLEFVNPDHDFPRKIVYARLEDGLFEAAVFAEADGAEPAFLLPYRRVRCSR